MRYLALSPLVFVLATTACGDGASQATPDAAPAAIDAAIDAPLQGGCDYTEQHDTTNDDLSQAGAPEPTGKMFTGAATTRLCGQLDSTHYAAADTLVDIDGYTVTVTADADVVVYLTGAGIGAFEYVSIDVYGGTNFGTSFGSGTFVADHGVLNTHLPAGTYELLVFAQKAAAITTPLPYEVRIVPDTEATRCPTVTTAAAYSEHLDTVANAHQGNDVVAITNPNQTLTTSTTDAPEQTQLTLTPGVTARIAGISADVPIVHSYRDRDTFELSTGAGTNELTARLTWPGTTRDLDLFVFEAGVLPSIGRALHAIKHGDELRTVAVKPLTHYWVLVGNDPSSDVGAVSYDLTVCGGAFVP